MRRVETPVTLAEAKERLETYRSKFGPGPHKAAWLAQTIWPDARFIRAQGAGAAATRVLKALGCYWTSRKHNWGWMISFPQKAT